jgi:hypothetical protein
MPVVACYTKVLIWEPRPNNTEALDWDDAGTGLVIACFAWANPQAMEKQIHLHFRAFAYKKFFCMHKAAVINHFASLI